MLKGLKRLVFVILLVCPLTFWGQGKKNYSSSRKSTPIVVNKHNYLSKDNTTRNYMYILGSVGTTILNGDNSTGHKLGFNGGFGFGYQINEYIGIEVHATYLTAEGKYKDIQSQDLNAIGGDFNLTVNLSNIIFGINPDRKFDVITHVGYGQMQSRGTVLYDDGRYASFGYSDIHYKNDCLAENGLVHGWISPNGDGINNRVVSATIPFGLDLCYNLNKYLKIHLDYSASYADTDRFDAVPAGDHYDWFSTVTARIQYNIRINGKKASPCDNMYR